MKGRTAVPRMKPPGPPVRRVEGRYAFVESGAGWLSRTTKVQGERNR